MHQPNIDSGASARSTSRSPRRRTWRRTWWPQAKRSDWRGCSTAARTRSSWPSTTGSTTGRGPGFEDLAAGRRPADAARTRSSSARAWPATWPRSSAARRPRDDRPPQLGHPVRDPVGLPREPQRAHDLGRATRSRSARTSSSSACRSRPAPRPSTPRTWRWSPAASPRSAARRRADRRRGLPGRPRGHRARGAPRADQRSAAGSSPSWASTWSRRSTPASASREIVRSTPVPILALGAKKLPREVDALELAATAIRDGARGVVFGRNLIGARSPERFLEALAGGRQAAAPSRAPPPRSTAWTEPPAAAAMTLLLGLDIGTTSVKAGVFDASGRQLAVAGEEYRLDHPAPDRAELDAETYWTAPVAAVRRGRWRRPAQPTRTPWPPSPSPARARPWSPVDRDGRPLGPAIVWLDNRARGGGARDRRALRRRPRLRPSPACRRSTRPGRPARSCGGAATSPRLFAARRAASCWSRTSSCTGSRAGS